MGYEEFIVQDLVVRTRTTLYRRERWLLPSGETVVAPLPVGITSHFGPELKRFVLAQYHQGQTTMPRLQALLQGLGLDISKRQLVRLHNAGQEAFLDEARDVLRTGRAYMRERNLSGTVVGLLAAHTAKRPAFCPCYAARNPPHARRERRVTLR